MDVLKETEIQKEKPEQVLELFIANTKYIEIHVLLHELRETQF